MGNQTTAFGPPGSEPVSAIPRDEFSTALRNIQDNPAAIGAGSTVHVRDMLGNAASWIVETWRADGSEIVFLQRNDAAGGTRFVLPPAVTARLAQQREQIIARARRRAARRGLETRRERGDQIGNPEALRKARGKRRAKR